VGFDNYRFELPEPTLVKMEQHITIIENEGIRVFRKTIRPSWWRLNE